jgi:fructose-1-phosphate kinase PfkB-like protein
LLEKYLKKLIGKTGIEDALKRLDKLTNEEVQMATAQVLRATHTVDDRVRVVEDKVLTVDNRVVGVDDKVAVVISGAQPSLISHQGNMFNSDVPRGKRDKGSHTTNGRRHGSSETLVLFILH